MKVLSTIALVLLVATASTPVVAQSSSDTIRHTQALQRYRAGQDLLASERFEKAAVEFSAATKLDPLFALAHYGLGQSYVGLRRYASAIQAFIGCREAYERIIALRDDNRAAVERFIVDEVHELQDMITAMRSGRYPGGQSKIIELEARIDELKRIRETHIVVLRPPAGVSLALGSAYFRNGDRELAETSWKNAVEINPKLGEAHNNLAVIYMTTNRLELAEQAISAAEKAGYRVNPQLKEDVKNKKGDK